MSEHHLKTWTEYYEAVENGSKTFEVRLNDRDFKAGDLLVLEEWDRVNGVYTGRSCERTVSFILTGDRFGIDSRFVVMAIQDTDLRSRLAEAQARAERAEGLLQERHAVIRAAYGEGMCESSGEIQHAKLKNQIVMSWLDRCDEALTPAPQGRTDGDVGYHVGVCMSCGSVSRAKNLQSAPATCWGCEGEMLWGKVPVKGVFRDAAMDATAPEVKGSGE